MVLEVTTNFELNADTAEQKVQVLPIFLHLYEQGLRNLYFSRNQAGRLLVWIDMNSPIPKSLSECFAGLTGCSIDSQVNGPFIPAHRIKVTSSVEVFKENIKTPAAMESFEIITQRHENLSKRYEALKKVQKPGTVFDSFARMGMTPGYTAGKSASTGHEGYEFINPFAKEREKREQYQQVEGECILLYRQLTSVTTENSVFAASAVASSSAAAIILPAELDAITVPDTTKKTDIINERETGVTLIFTPTTLTGMQLAEHDSEKILRELYQIIHNQPAPFNQINWVRNACGEPTKKTFSGAGISLATIQFDIARLSRVTSFSITLHRQTITKRSFSAFKEDTKIAMYKAGVENDYNFTGLDVKRTVVQSNTKKLAKLTASFEGNQPQWQVHRDNVNARYTLFAPKASQADALEAHLKAGGLKLFKRGQMTKSNREVVSVDLAQRDITATTSSNIP